MTHKQDLGRWGEDFAEKYLKTKGYRIIDRNYWKPWGEIDIVAVDKERILVFIEVKTVTGKNPYITAEDQVTHSKLTKLRRTCELYANNNQHLSENGWQINLIALNYFENNWQVKHYENI